MQLREERGMSREALAVKAGITATALSHIERGISSPGWETVAAIALALDVTLVEIASALEGELPPGL